jgi:hypothetical protein
MRSASPSCRDYGRRNAIDFRISFRSYLRPGVDHEPDATCATHDRRCIQLYISAKRFDDAERELRTPCGAIRYEIVAFPLLLYTCNCTNCQSTSGSAFGLIMPVAAKDFHILQGEPKGWHRKSPTGADVTSWFCGDCGGRIYGERVGRPQSMTLRAGTLDDTRWLVPIAHMYMRSAQPWMAPAANAECHESGPGDFRPLAQRWRAMWPEFLPQK